MTPPVRRDLPTYRELIYPTLRAVASLGGSAQGAEITDALIELLKVTPEQLAVTYDGRLKSVLINRMDWARSYAKLAGALDSPRRGLFILNNLGKHILSLPEEEGRAQVAQLDRDVRAARRHRGSAAYSGDPVEPDEGEPDEGETGIGASERDAEVAEDSAWREALLARLHRLSPAGFEEFTLYLLRTFGIELTRVGGVCVSSGQSVINATASPPGSDAGRSCLLRQQLQRAGLVLPAQERCRAAATLAALGDRVSRPGAARGRRPGQAARRDPRLVTVHHPVRP